MSDPCDMLKQPYRLYVERIDPVKNMARFYVLSIEPSLFQIPCLIRQWGRIGSAGQTKVQHFNQEGEAVSAFLDLLRAKRVRGYKPKKYN